MARRTGYRPELENDGIYIGPANEEWGRVAPNGTYVLNAPAMYLWLFRAATKKGGPIAMTTINMKWSATGGRGYDPAVTGALLDMEAENLVNLTKFSDGEILTVLPKASPQRALKKIPPYRTRAEVLAGLEPAED